jgi:dipeptidyl aminopeptidase/acylaminoacyl peptidase
MLSNTNFSISSVFYILFLILVTGCATSSHRNINYAEAHLSSLPEKQQLNVFAPRNKKEPKKVFVFIHGGNWNSGNKSLYNFLGRNMARKGIVTAVINYPLSPEAGYEAMAKAAAISVQWVKENISTYGGDPEQIFVGGHSAGGHLSALISIKNVYFDSLGIANPIKGAILIDAAGLDMYGYLKEQNYNEGHTYIKTFSYKPDQWKEATPLYHLHPGMPPLLIYRGGRTYPSIIKSNEKFVKALKSYTARPNYHVQETKKHIPMITQFIWPWNPRYREIIEFMDAPGKVAIQ